MEFVQMWFGAVLLYSDHRLFFLVSVHKLVIKMDCVTQEWVWIYVPFGGLQCFFYIEASLLRIKSSNTKVLKFQISVLSKLDSVGCIGFLHFVFLDFVSDALTSEQYWELMEIFFFVFPLGSWPTSYSWADRNVCLSSPWCHFIQPYCKNDQNTSFCFKN